jgi:hypothetical protein
VIDHPEQRGPVLLRDAGRGLARRVLSALRLIDLDDLFSVGEPIFVCRVLLQIHDPARLSAVELTEQHEKHP